ncbi:MAG: argininosuccinate lyase [Methanotrichaceae archaeon]|nr:argininosuccinate lyase [Methanotrichaceae archaeon]
MRNTRPDMFRDQRLGEISQEVLEYLSSRKADRRIFEADILADKAHLIMLKERGLISGETFSLIIKSLDNLHEEDLGPGEDIHEAIEAYLLARIGPEAGRIHTGRSRNDQVATSIRLALREQLLDLLEELQALILTLVKVAGEHTETLIPGFTHLQHAQPTTLAHQLLAHADAFLRDLDRIEETYARVNKSPLGSAAFASTGFKIDRYRTCQLLGFDGLLENSMDAVSTRDFVLEVLSDLSILMVNLSRLAEELILWSTSEFNYLEFSSKYASTSSIMPQKKNPDAAELARAKAGSVIGSLVSALTICKAMPLSYNRDLQEVTPHLWRGIDSVRGSVRIMNGCISTATFNVERLEKCSGTGFSTATELADTLVRIAGIPFRTAHQIVGKIAAKGNRPTLQELDSIAQEIAGSKLSELGLSSNDIEDALNPKSNIFMRTATGGPSPSETKRMVNERIKAISEHSESVKQMRGFVNNALDNLKKIK